MDNVEAVFKDSEEHHVTEKKEDQPAAIIMPLRSSQSQGVITSRICLIQNRFVFCALLRKGNLNVATEIFQVAPSLHVVQVSKSKGDTLEFHKFYKKLSNSLENLDEQRSEEKNWKVMCECLIFWD